MMDELLAFSHTVSYDIILLRAQKDFYSSEIEGLREKGIDVQIMPVSYSGFLRKIYVLIGFALSNLLRFRLNYNGVLGLKAMGWFLKLDLSNFSRESKIHSQFATQAALVSLLIKSYYGNAPKVSFTFHAHDIYFDNKWFNLLVNKSEKAFSISEFNIGYVSQKFQKSEKYELSRLGVFRSEKEKNREPHKPMTLGLLSWFTEKKGIQYLLEAMAKLSEEGATDVKLILAGDGPMKESILDFIKTHQLEGIVEYIGVVKGDEKDAFFSRIDAFVLPSIKLENDMDGIPVVLMEAIAKGLPIISTDVSGIPEICIDEFNGFLVEEKNPGQLKEAIEKLKNQPERYTLYSNNSFDLSKEYDIEINSTKKVHLLGWQ
jgi:glycosyltransferase involved in cell wall biosynthesis